MKKLFFKFKLFILDCFLFVAVLTFIEKNIYLSKEDKKILWNRIRNTTRKNNR